MSSNKIVKYKDSSNKPGFALVTQESGTTLHGIRLVDPSKGHGVRKSEYTGERELYRTSQHVTIPLSSVLSTHTQATLETYQEGHGYLLRQSIDIHGSLTDLPETCRCRFPLNPDISYAICHICDTVYHTSCLTDTAFCPACQKPFKRGRVDSDVPSPTKIPRNDSTSSRSGALPIDPEKYKHLAANSKQDLAQAVATVNDEFLAIQSSLSAGEKLRQQIIVKIVCALCLAREETGARMGLAELKKLAMEIETALYIHAGSRTNAPAYKAKVRSVTFNLVDEKNQDFRGGILKREIAPKDIVKMESRDMASGAAKSFREERQKQYAEEQLVVTGTSEKVLIKTHKGDMVLDISEEKQQPVKEDKDEDDPFNPNSHIEPIQEPLHERVGPWLITNTYERLVTRAKQYLPEDADNIIRKINMLNHNPS